MAKTQSPTERNPVVLPVLVDPDLPYWAMYLISEDGLRLKEKLNDSQKAPSGILSRTSPDAR